MMVNNSRVLESIIGGLLVVLLILPISMGRRGGTLFWMVFCVLALYLAATVTFAIVNRHHRR